MRGSSVENGSTGATEVNDCLIPLAHDRTKKERSLDVQATGKEAETSFEDLQLKDRTLAGLKKCGFHVPSPIQLKAIPFGKFGYGKHSIVLLITCSPCPM